MKLKKLGTTFPPYSFTALFTIIIHLIIGKYIFDTADGKSTSLPFGFSFRLPSLVPSLTTFFIGQNYSLLAQLWYSKVSKFHNDYTLNTVNLILYNAQKRPCSRVKEHFRAEATGSTSPLKWGHSFTHSLLSFRPTQNLKSTDTPLVLLALLLFGLPLLLTLQKLLLLF